MANSLKDDIVKFVVDIQSSGNQKKLIEDLKGIEAQSAALRKEQEDLRKAMAFLETTGRKNEEVYQSLSKTYKENEAQLKKNAAATKALQSGLDKTYMSSNQLQAKAKQLQKDLGGMSKAANPEEYARLEKELNEVNDELGKLHKGSRQTSESFITSKLSLQGIKDEAKGLLPAFGIGAVVAGIGMAGKSLFDLKKQMDGEGRRAAIVFGDSLKYVEGQAASLAEKMGLTNREFVSAAAGTADLLVPLGFTRQQSAEMAVQMTNLAGALDEWTAGKYGATEISSRLTRAVLGETDSLKELGIGIRLDSQEYKDLVKQKKEAGAATDAQAQSLAIMQMIMQKSTDAQNSYAGSGNELLRTQKSMESGWQSMKEGLVDYFSLSAAEKLQKEASAVLEQSNAIKKNNDKAEEMLATYERLIGKADRTEKEQSDLNIAINELAKFAPDAITKVDAYGNAMSISATKIRETMEAQRLLNIEMQKDVADNMSKKLKGKIEDINDYQGTANKRASDLSSTTDKDWEKRADLRNRGTISGIAVTGPQLKDQAVSELNMYRSRLSSANKEVAQYVLQLQKLGKTNAEIAQEAGVSWKVLEDKVKSYMSTVPKTDSNQVTVNPDSPKEKKKKDYSLNNDKEYQAASLKLKENYYKGLIKTEEEYSKKSLELEISTLQTKLDKGKLSKDERLQVELQLFDKRIALMKELQKEEDKEEEEKKKKDDKYAEGVKKLNEVTQRYGIKNTEDKISQLTVQEQADIAALDQSLKDTEEYEKAKKAIQDYYINLRKEETLKREAQDQVDKANAAVLNAETLDQEYQAKVELENIRFEQEKQRLIEQHMSTETLEAEHKQRLLALENSYTQQKIQIASSLMGATNNILGAMTSYYESQKQRELKAAGNDEKKKEEINKKYARKQQQIAIGQAIIAGAMAIMQIWAGQITGNPLIDAILKGVLTAAQVVTTGVQVSAIRNQQFREGGFTANAVSDDEPVGIVHANEFVATADAARNPTVKPILDVLDKAQRNKTIRTLDMRQVLGNGLQVGGYSTPSSSVTVNQDMGAIREATEVNRQLLALLKKPIHANVSMMGKNGIVEKQEEYQEWESNRNI